MDVPFLPVGSSWLALEFSQKQSVYLRFFSYPTASSVPSRSFFSPPEAQVKDALHERRGQMLEEVESFRARQQQGYERRRASLASTMLTRWRAIDFLEKARDAVV